METEKQNDSKNGGAIHQKRLVILGLLYFVALLWVVYFKCNALPFSNINQTNLTILERLQFSHVLWCPFCDEFPKSLSLRKIAEFVCNIVCFIPLGVLLRFFYKSFRSYALSVAVIVGIELLQLFTGIGGLQLSDLFYNSFGAYLGILLFDPIFAKLKPQTINKAADVLIRIAIPCDIFFAVSTIIYFL